MPQARAEEPEMIALRVLGLGRYGGAPAVLQAKQKNKERVTRSTAVFLEVVFERKG